MDVFELVAKLKLDSSGFESDLGAQESVFKNFGSKLGGFVSGAGKTIGVAVAAAGTAVAALTKSVVEAYGNYEQLVGGVETLFGAGGKSLEEYAETVGKTTEKVENAYNNLIKAQNLVLENSDKAWKTAGLSANEYMETVTGFSASLIQGLKGDQIKAAQYADMAITDMADNANKMGTAMGDIQRAYQGFAKQNYTMLDNLKLGYGGTKTEMQRLLKDAQKLTGIKYDINNFADIIEAIHVIQQELGITGTTAKEAEKTIQGSINATKAAWKNLIIEFGKDNADIQGKIDILVGAAETAFGNLMPVVEKALSGIATFIGKIAPIISEKIPGLVSDILPKLLNAALEIVNGIIVSLPDLIDTLFEAVLSMDWGKLGTSIIESIKLSIETAVAGIDKIFSGMFGEGWEIFKSKFTELLPVIAGVVSALAAFKVALDVSQVVAGFVSSISGAFAVLAAHPIAAVIAALVGLAAAIVVAYNTCDEFKAHVDAAWQGIQQAFGTIGEWFSEKFSAAREAIENGESWGTVGAKILEGIESGLGDLVGWLTGLFNSAADGIKSINWVEIGNTIREFILSGIETISTGITDFFTNAKSNIEGLGWSELGESIVNLIKSGLEGIDGLLTGLFGDEWTSVKQSITQLWEDISAAISPVIEKIQQGVEAVRSAYESVLQFLGLGGGSENPVAAAAQEAEATGQPPVTVDTPAPGEAVVSAAAQALGGVSTGTANKILQLSGYFDDGISGPANEAKESLEELLPLVRQSFDTDSNHENNTSGPVKDAEEALKNLQDEIKKNYNTFSWHDDQTSAAATTALDSLLALTPYDDYLTFSQSVFKNGTSGPVEKALWSLMQMLGWDGVSFDTKSVHFDNASEALKEILSLLEQAKAKDGQETHTKSTHENITINRTINQGEANKASKGQQEVLNATAMHGGRILRGATIFGTDANGRNMVGGEVGPEAIVGVNSLDQMIQASVSRAMNAVLGRLDRIINGRGENIQVVLDTGVLVGELVGGMDSEMNRRAAWRGGGRA